MGNISQLNQNDLKINGPKKPDLFSLSGETELFQNDKGITIKIDRSKDVNLTDFGKATLLDRYLGQGESFQDLWELRPAFVPTDLCSRGAATAADVPVTATAALRGVTVRRPGSSRRRRRFLIWACEVAAPICRGPCGASRRRETLRHASLLARAS